MPIAIHDDAQTTRLVEEPFKNEAELQACLERSPYLLVSESEPQVATVQREVALPSAGILDLLVVDKEGLPVAVEVKLARNAQSRREVVAQAFDYVADLSTMSFEELDDLVDGALAGALTELGGTEQSMALRKQCATNLRAGKIRLVIAVDAASEDLIRIVRYITDHSDIDVRLICISQFDKGKILVPRILVASSSETPNVVERSRPPKDGDMAFDAVTDAYAAVAEKPWQAPGRQKRWRQVYHDEWPAGVHYEFVNYPDEIGVELHLESDDVKKLAAPLAALSGQELVTGIVVQWCRPGSWRNGQLRAKVGKDQNPAVAVQAMQELIKRTRAIVETGLAQ